MYRAIVKIIQEKKLATSDIVVADITTLVGSDICEMLNVSCIINNPEVLAAVRWFVIPPVDYNPTNCLNNSIHTLGTNMLMRALLSIVWSYITLYTWFTLDSRFNKLRKSVGLLKSSSILTGYSRHVIIANTASGLEYNRLLSPNIQWYVSK
ncbi:unnamed protein product [Rotaria magnacalcarata]|uniref:Uncharacterized protein n=1 Tax=Rotaria magnacalcarata TaxID=392030 RepID=A0A819ZK30_9BILA|nr:unnamed protein product [Rotaria magnacalcarata]CAF4178356.1 unnamed protein product [Rotaria magnacalcarata]